MQSIKLEYCVTIATLLLVTCYLVSIIIVHHTRLTADHMAATQTHNPHSYFCSTNSIILYCYPLHWQMFATYHLSPCTFSFTAHQFWFTTTATLALLPMECITRTCNTAANTSRQVTLLTPNNSILYWQLKYLYAILRLREVPTSPFSSLLEATTN